MACLRGSIRLCCCWRIRFFIRFVSLFAAGSTPGWRKEHTQCGYSLFYKQNYLAAEQSRKTLQNKRRESNPTAPVGAQVGSIPLGVPMTRPPLPPVSKTPNGGDDDSKDLYCVLMSGLKHELMVFW